MLDSLTTLTSIIKSPITEWCWQERHSVHWKWRIIFCGRVSNLPHMKTFAILLIIHIRNVNIVVKHLTKFLIKEDMLRKCMGKHLQDLSVPNVLPPSQEMNPDKGTTFMLMKRKNSSAISARNPSAQKWTYLGTIKLGTRRCVNIIVNFVMFLIMSIMTWDDTRRQ